MKKKVRSQEPGVRSRKAREEVPVPETRNPNPETRPFLLEIGCEEIPARFIADAQKQLRDRLSAALASLRLLPDGSAETYSTPRRLIVYMPAVLNRQPHQTEQIVGPPVKVAFDAAGKPTRAAESFAEKSGVKVADLVRVSTPKGEYLAAWKAVKGRAACELLAEALPSVITGIAFPKTMYWTAKSGPRFIRPIRWLLALFGEGRGAQVIRFGVPGVESSNVTYGHRLTVIPAKLVPRAGGGAGIQKPACWSAPIPVSGFADYQKKLRAVHVEIDPARRRETVQRELKALLEPMKLRAVSDPWLEDWVVNSTEWPHAIIGSFDAKFLSLPREILITVMRDHQKYFAVESVGSTGVSPVVEKHRQDAHATTPAALQPRFVAESVGSTGVSPVVEKHGQDAHATTPAALQPRFVAILNREDDPKGLIRAGHERVLRARFTDAQFFWDTDQKIPLRDRLPLLEKVTYQEKLGSYADKVRRMKAIAHDICNALEAQRRLSKDDTANVLRAVELCKCDLTTQMVQEFPELQGVLGGLYAKRQGECRDVADAIYDHYTPVNIGDACPRSVTGLVVSLADKVDTIVGGFYAGSHPSGSSDPLGLRRQGNAVVKLLLRPEAPDVNSAQLLKSAAFALPESQGADRDAVGRGASAFLAERLAFYLESQERLRADTIRSALAVEWHGLVRRVRAKAAAVQGMLGSEDFAAVCEVAKRVRNILKQASTGYHPGVNTSLFQARAERELHERAVSARQELIRHDAEGNYGAALEVMAGLRPYVAAFFDKPTGVLVMCEDQPLRNTRLGILDELDRLFLSIADLSQIESTASTFVGATTMKETP